jgi:hypothetical protein
MTTSDKKRSSSRGGFRETQDDADGGTQERDIWLQRDLLSYLVAEASLREKIEHHG